MQHEVKNRSGVKPAKHEDHNHMTILDNDPGKNGTLLTKTRQDKFYCNKIMA